MNGDKITITGVGPIPKVLALDREIIVGRSVKADIQIDGDLVSRQHCRIWQEDGIWRFQDLQSRNGTLLNGDKADTGELHNGDVLMIGYGKMLFEIAEAEHVLSDSDLEVSIVDVPLELDAASAVLADVDDDSSNKTMALSYRDLVMVNQRLSTISKVGQQLATILDRDELLRAVLDTLFELYLQADRGAVVLRDASDMFRVAATRSRAGMAATTSVMNISSGLIGLVRKERKSVLSADTGSDSRFQDRQSIVGTAGRSVMCAPLLREQEFFGVVYLDTQSLAQPFTSVDLNLLQGVVGPVAVALKNAELVGRIETETRMRTSLARYLSPDVVRQIGEGAIKASLGGDQVEGTVMFSDIVGFTAMSERLQPTEVVARLNRYFTQMLEAIFGWNGTVDKFGGDAIMAVWGAPVPTPEHPQLAVGGALEMHQRLFDLNCAFEDQGEKRIGMALGLNSGKFVAGNIGGAERIEWTVIGDNVNLAQRVESQGFGGCVLCSESTYSQLQGAGAYRFPPVHVKNRQEPVTIYSVRALKSGRGATCSIPGELKTRDGVLRALVVKSQPRTGGTRVTIYCSGAPPQGTSVEFVSSLPERPAECRFTGRVAAQSPLIESTTARSVDVDVETADAEIQRLLGCTGAVDAPLALDQIKR
ncbi:MAG: FHA domain-containing protein [Planctomycetes bacterium]|nr:FHA domain-containing protein [Planctomycetota bacterium]